MPYNRYKHHRKSIRIPGYDYSQPGLYFITICAKDKENIFGEIHAPENFNYPVAGVQNSEPLQNAPQPNQSTVTLFPLGNIANKCWMEIPSHYPNVILHESILMPNHIHGIIEIKETNKPNNNISDQPLKHEFQKIIPKSIGSIIRGYKIGVTKEAHSSGEMIDVWQRNFYEHIIRGEKEFYIISDYIINNPLKWKEDRFYST